MYNGDIISKATGVIFMPFIIEFRTTPDLSGSVISKLDLLLNNQERIMATLSEIQAALVELETLVLNEDVEFDAKVAELTTAVNQLQSDLAASSESNAALNAAVTQLQAELAAANDPAVLESIASKIAEIKAQVVNIVE